MKTNAVRLHGKNDLRLESFDLPPIKEDEILAHVISDSICMSSHKEALQGSDHKRVPQDISDNPIIIGHEFCGEIIEVGKKWQEEYKDGQLFNIQPNIKYKKRLAAPGYSYPFIGGDATYIIIPNEVMEMNCLLHYNGDGFFYGSLAEPMSCIVASFRATFHIEDNYRHDMGLKHRGSMAILGGGGPMGLGAIDYAIHGRTRPSNLVVTDIDNEKLKRAAYIHTVKEASQNGVDLIYVNTSDVSDAVSYLQGLVSGKGYDDVFIFTPTRAVVEQGGYILARDGCLNFFAGPIDPKFSATINFYDVHYLGHHVVGTSGGNTDDMIESLNIMEKQTINPAAMITHIGGLNSVVETTLNLPNIPGGKKLIYTNIELDLISLDEIRTNTKPDSFYQGLSQILKRTNGIWCVEAEKLLLDNAKRI